MKLIATCQVCRKRRLLVRRRVFRHAIAGEIVSQSEMCRTCYKGIKSKI